MWQHIFQPQIPAAVSSGSRTVLSPLPVWMKIEFLSEVRVSALHRLLSPKLPPIKTVRHFYRPSTKLWEANIFSRVCLSVSLSTGGGVPSHVTITHDALDLTKYTPNPDPAPPQPQGMLECFLVLFCCKEL